jgi:hypothetical protein
MVAVEVNDCRLVVILRLGLHPPEQAAVRAQADDLPASAQGHRLQARVGVEVSDQRGADEAIGLLVDPVGLHRERE